MAWQDHAGRRAGAGDDLPGDGRGPQAFCTVGWIPGSWQWALPCSLLWRCNGEVGYAPASVRPLPWPASTHAPLPCRLCRRRMIEGQPSTVVYIGGSVTTGRGATRDELGGCAR